jgi:hypothetical protein
MSNPLGLVLRHHGPESPAAIDVLFQLADVVPVVEMRSSGITWVSGLPHTLWW